MEFCDCISYKGKENMQEMLLLLKRYGFAGAIVLVKDDIFDEKIFESMILPREFKVFLGSRYSQIPYQILKKRFISLEEEAIYWRFMGEMIR
jgi:hypothetical protein